MPTRIAARAAVAAFALTMTLAGIAMADSVDADADVVASGTQGLINLGTVAAGSTHTLDIGFTLVCKGTSHAAVGSTVTLNPTATPPTEGGTITATAASVGPVPVGWPAAGDACVGDPVVPSTNPSHVSLTAPTVGGTFTYRVTFTRSPNTGTSGTTLAQITLSVVANTPPELDLPGDLTKEADTTGGWTAAFTVGATDAEDASDPAVTCSVDQGDVLPLGHTTVDCSATDTGGLTATGSFDVDVVDTTAPVLGALPSPSASTTDPSGTAVSWTDPSATDVADPSPVVTCAPASGSVFAIGTTTVTCTAADASGNHASGTFDVTVTLDTPPDPNPDPGPGPALGVLWVSPLGDAPLVGRLGRSIPVKAGVAVDGMERTPDNGAAPTLRADRLDGCTTDDATTASMDLGVMRWSDGRWSLVIDTTQMTAGCWRLVVVVDGHDAGGALVRLVADAAVGGAKPPATLNGHKPHTFKDAFTHHRHRHGTHGRR